MMYLRVWLTTVIIATIYASMGVADVGKCYKPIYSNGELVVAATVATDAPYHADNTGKTDASSAIQKMVNDVNAHGGGTAFLPAGRYRLDHHIALPASVTLCGEWRKPQPGQPLTGTILLAYADKGKPDGPALLSSQELGHANVYNLTVYYPEQNPVNPIPYPYTLQGNVSYICNITLVNSYQGIVMAPFSGSSVSGVYGTVLKRGIVLKNSSELCSCYNIRLNSDYWARLPEARMSRADAAKLRRFVADELVAVQVAKVDGLSFHNADLAEAKTPVLVKLEEDDVQYMMTDRSQYGFGGGIGKVKGRRTDVEGGWYFGTHYFDLDNYPQLQRKSYRFAALRQAAKRDVYQATDFGVKADKTSDDTAALQRALDKAGANGGGTVLLPHGWTVLRAPITIPTGVELRGGYLGVGVRAWYLDVSTLIIGFDERSNDPDNAPAAINLKANAGLRGVAVCHEKNVYETGPDGKLVVSIYPYAIRGLGKGVYVHDVTMPNAYNGIDLGQVRCDRAQVVNFWCTPYHRGVRVGANSDGVQLENLNMDYGLHSSDYRLITGFPEVPGNKIIEAIQGYLDDHSVQYEFGDCTNLRSFHLAGFAPRFYMDFVDQGRGGCRDAQFWSTVFDVPKVEVVRFRGGGQISFNGFFVTGGGNKQSLWAEFDDSFKGKVDVYGLCQQLTFNSRPFTVGSDKLNIYLEHSLTTKRPASASSAASGHGPANALDGDSRTFWQSEEGSGPHILTVELAKPSVITRWRTHLAGTYLPHQLNAAAAELYGSIDGVEYRKLAEFKENTQDWVDLPVTSSDPVRFVQLRVTKVQQPGSSGHAARIAAFDVFGYPAKP